VGRRVPVKVSAIEWFPRESVAELSLSPVVARGSDGVLLVFRLNEYLPLALAARNALNGSSF
jgi:hypothetical protein